MLSSLRALMPTRPRPHAGGTPASPAQDRGRASVVVPLYNHRRYAVEAVRSALSQGDVLREVIVVDDGSTDGSAEAVLAACGEDPRLVCWSQPNRGAHAAINAGLLRATGEVLFILNSDDVYLPGRLDAVMAAFDAEPGADLVATGLRFMDGEGAPVANAWYGEALAFHAGCGDPATALINANFVMTTSNFAFRRTLMDRIGLFAPLRYAHDLDFLLRALARGCGLALLMDRELVGYRIHATNTIKEDHGAVRMEWAAVAAGYLSAAMAGGGAGTAKQDRPSWQRLAEIGGVLERHALLRAVQLCQAHLQARGATSLEHDAMLADPGFRAALQGCV